MKENITIVVSHYIQQGKEQEFERAIKQVISLYKESHLKDMKEFKP